MNLTRPLQRLGHFSRSLQETNDCTSSKYVSVTLVASTDFPYTGKHDGHEITTISMLSEDVLLGIFNFCRKNQTPTSGRPVALPEAAWDWHILVHVCRRWRQVVFASPLRLNLQVLCTHRTPVRKHLDIWPSFPIIIEYTSQIKGADEDNIISALAHSECVCTVGLWLTGQQLGNMVTVMPEPFPALRHMFLAMDCLSNDVPVIPHEFMGRSAPSLQTIQLVGIPFPALPALLLS